MLCRFTHKGKHTDNSRNTHSFWLQHIQITQRHEFKIFNKINSNTSHSLSIATLLNIKEIHSFKKLKKIEPQKLVLNI